MRESGTVELIMSLNFLVKMAALSGKRLPAIPRVYFFYCKCQLGVRVIHSCCLSKIKHRLVCLRSRLDGIRAESWFVSREARTCVRPRALLWQSQIRNKTRIPHVPDAAMPCNGPSGPHFWQVFHLFRQIPIKIPQKAAVAFRAQGTCKIQESTQMDHAVMWNLHPIVRYLIFASASVDALTSSSSLIAAVESVDQFQQWPSALPLPHRAKDGATATRSRDAMRGPYPTALDGRCQVDLDGFDGGVRFVHVDPPILVVDNFLTEAECNATLQLTTQQLPADAGRVIRLESRSYAEADHTNRLSTTWYVRYGCAAVAPLLNSLVTLLPNVRLKQVEEVQLVRYAGSGQGFGWHEDALNEDMATPESGGQRIATVLVYLDECDNGRTIFRDLLGDSNCRLSVSPKRGRALLFFPSATGATVLGDDASFADNKRTFGKLFYDNTRADHRTVHAGEPPTGYGSRSEKHIAQLWIHSTDHTPVVFGRGLNGQADANLP